MTQVTASARIRMLRPLMIFFVMVTHVPGTLYRPDIKDVTLTLGTFLYALLSGALAVSAMPTLSVISGYLAVGSLSRTSYFTLMCNKILKLIIPMLLWGLPVALWVYYMQSQGVPFRSDLALYPFEAYSWFKALAAFGVIPVNPPLYFLRELFFCFLLLPLFVIFARSRVVSVLLLMGVAYCAVEKINFGFFLRIDIYGFFFAGVFLACHPEIAKWENILMRWKWVLTGLFFVSCAGAVFYALGEEPKHFWVIMKALTVAGPLIFWLTSVPLVKTLPGKVLTWLSPVSFTVFLGHIIVINAVWQVWVYIFKITPYQQGYSIFWVFCIVLSFGGLGLITIGYRRLRMRYCYSAK